MGLEKAGKTHMLYNYLVGEGGMHTIKQLKETLGMNFEFVSESRSNFNVWDISGNPYLRPNWKLYLKNIQVRGLIYVVNVCEDIERIRESCMEFHKLTNEPVLSECVLALVFNFKQNVEETYSSNK